MTDWIINSIFIVSMVLIVYACGQCPSNCTRCDPGGTAVCDSVCPSKVNLPADTTTFIQTGNGKCAASVTWTLRKDDFINFGKLQHLSITHSNVIGLNPRQPPFQNLTNLLSLNLAHNIIRTYGNHFENLTKLEELDLSYNSLAATLNSSLATLTRLKTLNFDHNQLKTLYSETFSGLVSLETLTLSNNPLVYIDKDTFKPLAHLQTLHLRNDSLSQAPSGMFSQNQMLKLLDLSHNSIHSLNDDSLVGPSLDELDLSYNQLSSIPTAAIKGSTNQLIKLSLSHNLISHISNSDIKDLRVQTLDLSNNLIHQIPKDFFQNAHVVNVNFSGNPIDTIEDGTLDGLQISSLDLSNTRLVTLPKSAEQWLASTAARLNLSNANWQCDCNTLWLAEILSSKSNTSVVYPTCGTGSAAYSGHSLDAAKTQMEADCITTTTATTTLNTTESTTQTTPTTSSSTTTTTQTTAPTTIPTTTPTPTTTSASTTRTTSTVSTTTSTTTTSTTPAPQTPQAPTTTSSPATGGPIQKAAPPKNDLVDVMPIVLAAVCTVALCLAVAGLIAGCYLFRKTNQLKAQIQPLPPLKLAWQPT